MKRRNITCALAAALAPALLTLTGCVERRLTFLSNPEGSQVELNGEAIGRTPVTVAFEWYGDYDIILRYVKTERGPDGQLIRHPYYLHTHQRAYAPPHQWLGLDLITELMPMKFEDHKTWAFVVPELPNPTDVEMIERAIDLRSQIDKPDEFKKNPD